MAPDGNRCSQMAPAVTGLLAFRRQMAPTVKYEAALTNSGALVGSMLTLTIVLNLFFTLRLIAAPPPLLPSFLVPRAARYTSFKSGLSLEDASISAATQTS